MYSKVFFYIVAIGLIVSKTLGQSGESKVVTADVLTSVVSVGESVKISPDGQWLIFSYTKKVSGERRDAIGNRMVKIAEGGISQIELPAYATLIRSAAWRPDSSGFAFISANGDEIRFFNINEMLDISLKRLGEIRKGFEGLTLRGIDNLTWSPDGKRLAFTVETKVEKSSLLIPTPMSDWRAVEVEVEEPLPPVEDRPANVLCILDGDSGRAIRLTDRSLNIPNQALGNPSLSWSPDGTRIVFAATDIDTRQRVNRSQSHLYTIGEDGDAPTPLVKKVRTESLRPLYSPDGLWIAFEYGDDVGNKIINNQIAVIPAAGGEMKVIAAGDNNVYGGDLVAWNPDSRSIYFKSGYHMASHLFLATINGITRQITPEGGGTFGKPTISSDGRTIAFAHSDVNAPPEVYVASADFSTKLRLTDLNAHLHGIRMPSYELVKWRSADAKFDIHGILVKPPDFVPGKRYPLIVISRGGPSMIMQRFGLEDLMPPLLFAEKGYLVLSANSRARGGYGRKFATAVVADGLGNDEEEALWDVTSGVNELVSRGLVDPNRVGWAGWSYGARLGASAVWRTNIFRAAWLGDILGIDRLFLYQMGNAGSNAVRENVKKQYGFDLLSPEQIKKALSESTIYNMHKIKTPVLLECGGKSSMIPNPSIIFPACRIFFQNLRAHNVPSELWVFKNDGHGWFIPFQREESFARQLEWFNYWIRGIATERMLKRYGPPKNPERPATAIGGSKK